MFFYQIIYCKRLVRAGCLHFTCTSNPPPPLPHPSHPAGNTWCRVNCFKQYLGKDLNYFLECWSVINIWGQASIHERSYTTGTKWRQFLVTLHKVTNKSTMLDILQNLCHRILSIKWMDGWMDCVQRWPKAWFSMPPNYLRQSRWHCLEYCSDIWEYTSPTTTTTIAGLCCWHACEVELKSTSQAYRRKGLWWLLLPVAYVLISEQYPRQYRQLCRR